MALRFLILIPQNPALMPSEKSAGKDILSKRIECENLE